jgi:hypothetical protein
VTILAYVFSREKSLSPSLPSPPPTSTTSTANFHRQLTYTTNLLTPPTYTTNLHHQLTPPTYTTNLHHQLPPPTYTTNFHHQLTPPLRHLRPVSVSLTRSLCLSPPSCPSPSAHCFSPFNILLIYLFLLFIRGLFLLSMYSIRRDLMYRYLTFASYFDVFSYCPTSYGNK